MAKIKRYKLGEGGKLILQGEVSDNTISEAETGTFPVSIDERGTVALVEGAVGPTKAEIAKAKREIKDEAVAKVRDAFKRLRPNASERELDIMATGKAPEENKSWIK
jgi:hypothetical protein